MQIVHNERPINVLFLCPGNSARSIIAESVLNRLAVGKFKAYSAGSKPLGHVHSYALDLLRKTHFHTSNLRSNRGRNSPSPAPPSSISSSRSATTRRTKSARSGPANP